MRNKGLGKFIMQILQLIAHRYFKKVKKRCMYKRTEGPLLLPGIGVVKFLKE